MSRGAYYILVAIVYFCSACSSSDNRSGNFELVITGNAVDHQPVLRYTLTDSTLTVLQLDSTLQNGTVLQTIPVAGADSIARIASLDIKARDCREQHALQEYTVRFTHNDTTVHVDPNVNHPKELDIAVRLINQHVGTQWQLHFTDMQGAIEPNGKMEL